MLVEYPGTQVVLRVCGEVDPVTAPELGAILGAVLDRGHRDIILDLADLDFMDASGLRVISVAAARLGLTRGQLTIRSASAMVHRILHITGLAALVRLSEPEAASSDDLGSEQPVRTADAAPGPAWAGLAAGLGTGATVSTEDDSLVGALRLVVALAHAAVAGADGVSVSLRRHGCLTTVAATDQTISDMDADQYATGEGPCVDASVEGRWFHAGSLATETRWPDFTPKAQALGIKAILSSPLLVGDQPVGALNIYSRTAGAFAPEAQVLASVFATEASTVLTEAKAHTGGDRPPVELSEALRAREVVAQALGVIMERDGADESGAHRTLRRLSIASGRPLRQEAEGIVGSAGRRPPDPPVQVPSGWPWPAS
ncbi:MAG: anti-sigma factor antagonist [Acidimicrobiales bacterium]